MVDKVKEKFCDLVDRHVEEGVYIEFKQAFNMQGDIWKAEMLGYVNALFNNIPSGTRERSVDGKDYAAFILYGIKDRGTDKDERFYPFQSEEEYPDSCLISQLRKFTRPEIKFHMYVIKIEVSDQLTPRPGLYVMVEIILSEKDKPSQISGFNTFIQKMINNGLKKKWHKLKVDETYYCRLGSEVVHESTLTSYQRAQLYENGPSIPGCLSTFEWITKKERQSHMFRIGILLNRSTQEKEPSQKKDDNELLMALGQLNFNIFVNFGERDEGGEEPWAPLLREWKKTTPYVTWKSGDIKSGKSNIDRLVERKEACFINLEGALTKQQLITIKQDLQKFLTVLFQKLPPSGIAVSIVALSPMSGMMSDKTVADFYKKITEEFERGSNKITGISFTFISERIAVITDSMRDIMDLVNKSKNDLDDDLEKYENFHVHQVVAELTQITNTIRRILHETEEDAIIIPGEDGEIEIEGEEYAMYSSYFDIYHKSIGKDMYEWHTRQEKEKKRSELQTEFLRGGPMTAALLYLNHTAQSDHLPPLFVKRAGMESTFLEIKTLLEQAKTRGNEELKYGINKIDLKHMPSAGGSTLGLHILYEMRRDFPSIVLRPAVEDQLYIELQKLNKKSRKPLFILCDNPFFDQEKVSVIRRNLNSKSVRFVILHVEQVQKFTKSVLLKLTENEKEAFDIVYEKYLKDAKEQVQPDQVDITPFLYGVLSFKKDYKGIKKGVQANLTGIEDGQKEVICFCCLVSMFTDQGLDYELMATLLQVDLVGEESIEKVLQKLGNARYLLVLKSVNSPTRNNAELTRKLFAPAVNAVREEIFKYYNWKETDQIENMVKILQKLAVMREEQLGSQCQQLDDLVISVAKKGKEDQRFSRFFITMSEKYDIGEMERICSDLRNSYPGHHILINCARLMMFEKHNSILSLKILRDDFEISSSSKFSDTKCTDIIRLTIGAHLLIESMKYSLKKQGTISSKEKEDLYELGEDTLHLLEKVNQQIKMKALRQRPHSYYHELTLRYLFLRMLLERICNNDKANFINRLKMGSHALDSKDSIKSFFEAAMKLEQMHLSGMIDTENAMNNEQSRKMRNMIDWVIKQLGPDALKNFDLEAVTIVDRYIMPHQSSPLHSSSTNPNNKRQQQLQNSNDYPSEMHVNIWHRAQNMSDLPNEKLMEVFNTLEHYLNNVQSTLFTAAYFDIAMSCFWYLKKCEKINNAEIQENLTKRALKHVQNWVHQTNESDIVANFMLAVFNFALSESGFQNISTYKKKYYELFDKNKTIAESRIGIVGSNKLRFYICKGDEKGMAIFGYIQPSLNYNDQLNQLRPRMKIYNGYVIDPKTVFCEELRTQLFIKGKEDRDAACGKKKCTFGIALSFTKFMAYDIQYIDR